MSKYFDGKLLSAYEDLNKEFECKKENVKLHQQIADLEAKLAEKDKTIENWQTMYQSVMKSCHNGIEEDKRLREQLAEKEKEIDEVKKWWAYQYEGNTKRKDQDKISFCIEQLEKVKDKALHFYVNDTPKLTGFYIDVNEINNQIEELKKEMGNE